MKNHLRLTFSFLWNVIDKARSATVAVSLILAAVSVPAATVADWQFNAANPTLDSSGNGNTLTFNGDAVTFSGDIATNAPGATNSIVFDGNSYAQTAATLNLTSFNQLTIECFAKYVPATGLQMFYAQNNPNNVTGALYFDLGESSSTGLKFCQRTSLGFETEISPGPTDGAWHHFAVTVDQTGSEPVIKIYVDGLEVETGNTPAGYQAFINDYFTIGAYPPSYIFGYNGEMGEMRISSGILPPSQFLIGTRPPQIAISQQPVNTAAVTNTPATFQVIANVQGGNPTPSPTYQWQINGSNISGATNSSYTFPSVALAQNSAFIDVTVSATGATTLISSNAILTVATNATVADWQFNAANPGADSSGNGNSLIFGGDGLTFSSDTATNAPGATNSAVFDGGAYAQTAGTLNLSLYSAITIELFAKYTPSNGLEMFYAHNNPNYVTGGFYLDSGEASSTDLKMGQSTPLGFETDISPGPADGNWHHLALTLDESGTNPIVKIYMDGLEVDTGGASAGLQSFINDYFTIGAYPPSYNFNYNGEMGEMRVSFGVLAPAQFLIGAQPPTITIVNQPQNTGSVTNSPATFTVAATVQNGNPPPALLYQWQMNGVSIAGATNSVYTIPSVSLTNNLAQIDVVVSAQDAASVTSSNAVLTVMTNAAIAYWQFNAANPTADSSGNNNILALNGNITFSSDVPSNAPASSNSAVFDGASYAQTIGALNLAPYDQLTIEFFAKYSSGTPLQMFFAVNNVNTTSGAFYLDTGEAGPALLKLSQRTSVPTFVAESAPEPTDGNWHHYAVTMDESAATGVFKLYVDGVEVDGTGVTGHSQAFINDFFTIGGFPPADNFEFNGLMSDFRISTGILPPDQFLTGPAVLQINGSNGNVIISWPQNAENYTLQQTRNLLGPWTTVTNSPITNGYNLQVTVPNTPGAMYYRLVR